MNLTMNLTDWTMAVNLSFNVLWGIVLLVIILVFIVVGRRASR
jgi:hypothetical protein